MIKKITTKFVALLLSFNLVLSGPAFVVLAEEASPAPSATTTAENQNTGSSSDNTATNTTNNTADTTNNNTANTQNTAAGDVTSGSNTSSNNTGTGTVDTGNTSAGVSTDTTVNQNTYSPMEWTTWTGDGDWQSSATNTQTGSNSTNTATNTTNTDQNLTNNNTANIGNNTDMGVSTGSNTASQNTGDANITTGDASATSSTKNIANLNVSYWTGSGDWSNMWNGEALNKKTGSNSTNTAQNDLNSLFNVLNNNNADINNIINAGASSGSNTASDNTGNATISTGNASLLATLFNMANTNIFGTKDVNILYQDIFGSHSGNIDLSTATPYSLYNLDQNPLNISTGNNMTGYNSDNEANVNGSLTFDILNNNDGNLVNDLDLAAITGNNTASDNTGDANIETGDADIIANLINMLNTNIFTNQFYFGVVNVYGDWLGNLILPEYPNLGTANTGALSADTSNSFTGSNSTNQAGIGQTQNLGVDNNNDGIVDNNFNLGAQTGGNTASDNTTGGSITTGQAYGDANVANYVNTNVVSDTPWWLIMVNNMGKWIPILQNPLNGAQMVLDLDTLGATGTASTGGDTSAEASNSYTGTNSDNVAGITNNVDGSITNNNTGNIINNVDAMAITGNNTASRNTGTGSITTGDASLWINTLNFLNTNIVAPSFLLTIVNVFGNWTGDILNHGDNAQIPSGGTSNNETNSTANNTSNTNNNSGGTTTTTNNNSSSNHSTTSNSSNSSNTLGNSIKKAAGAVQSAITTFGNTETFSFSSDDEDEDEGQVLSFSAENDEEGGSAANSNNFSINSIKIMTLGGLLALLLLAVVLRTQIFGLIKKPNAAQ